MSVAAKTRENREESTSSSVDTAETCVKNLDERVCLQSEKKQEWIREKEDERRKIER